jgi:hypothetical protein
LYALSGKVALEIIRRAAGLTYIIYRVCECISIRRTVGQTTPACQFGESIDRTHTYTYMIHHIPKIVSTNWTYIHTTVCTIICKQKRLARAIRNTGFGGVIAILSRKAACRHAHEGMRVSPRSVRANLNTSLAHWVSKL